eukprot:TRINITY_DN29386_c0_g1_i1.p1 TRINITY_DN29386_c0_g1~~TRINITY_DN29386_c0_g1_i1.p1  ORF type:complete len:205 (+),score=42.75 TRINITY_DN29386_c0_g1_i1:36-650(+)
MVSTTPPGTFTVHVRAISGEMLCMLEAAGHWTVEQVKNRVAPLARIPVYNQHLLLGVEELCDVSTLEELGDEGPLELCLVRKRNAPQGELSPETSSSQIQILTAEEELLQLWGDLQSVLSKVQRNGMLLQHAGECLKANRQVVLAAVQSSGQALRYASPELRADREVCLAAVRNDPLALKYAAREVRDDIDFMFISSSLSLHER